MDSSSCIRYPIDVALHERVLKYILVRKGESWRAQAAANSHIEKSVTTTYERTFNTLDPNQMHAPVIPSTC